MDLLEEAQRYLAAGLRPVPVRSRGKAPALDSWREYQKRAPTEDELASWTWPGNIGTVIPPGVIVIDFDGGKAAEALLLAAGVTLPESAPRVASGSGGCHVYLRLPAGVPDFPKVPGKNFLHSTGPDGAPCKPFVEVLTATNFAVLPPSVHPSGRSYAWAIDLDGPIPEVPAALLALVAATRGAAPGKPGTNPTGWVEQLSRGVEYGSIDDAMTKLAGHYLRKGLPEGQVIDILTSGFAQRCTRAGQPFKVPLADVERVVRSIGRAEGRKPRGGTVAGDFGGSGTGGAGVGGDGGAGGGEPFQLLGYDHDLYYYLSRDTGQLVPLSAQRHDKNNLLRLASLRHWEAGYGTEHGVAWSAAQAALLDRQHRVGVFDPDRVRGRGAWWDEGVGAVMHTGQSLLMAGRSVPVRDLPPGRYVYELSRPLDVELGEPLTAERASMVAHIFDRLPWASPQSARLASGWCVVATVCGAVAWRPHLWITGPSGTGKSWTMDHIVRRLLGNLALAALSETTGAGLRQTLGHDARPVIFDEAEAEGRRGGARMDDILALMRQSSSEGGGTIIKGSSEGVARTYRVRSCFAMSSVNVAADQAADRSRIAVLEMRVDHALSQEQRDQDFANLRKRVSETLTDPYVTAFRSRCVRMIPVIRENARLFAVAAAGHIGSRRMGDQVGTLLAGAYSLVSDDSVTPDEAEALMAAQDFEEERGAKEVSDEEKLLDKILSHVLKVRAPIGVVDRSVGDLIRIAAGREDEVASREAGKALLLIGIKMREAQFIVANQHPGIESILRDTHWNRSWGRVLARLPQAEKGEKVWFGLSGIGRGTYLPVELING